MSQTRLSNLAAEVKAKIPFPDLFRELYPDKFRKSGDSHCPCHENHKNGDEDPAFQVNDDYGFCHVGCKPPGGKSKSWSVIDLWMKKKRVDFKTALSELAEKCGIHHEPGPKRNREPIATYDYVAKNGELLFQVCRYEPKDFCQRIPDGNGGWTWKLGDTLRVLYRLPEVLKADVVWLCEGEKDADNLAALELCGTTSPQGAGKWKSLVDKYRIHEPLKGKHVHILPDNDQAGRDHAQDVAPSLHGFAASVKILELPGLPKKGDVSDFIEKHGVDARPVLEEIAAKTPEYQPPEPVRFGSYTCAKLMAADVPDVRWVVPGLLCEGLVILAGSPKIGKSWLVLSLCLSIAAGDRALSQFSCNTGDVLYLALEDNPRRLKKRLLKMGVKDDTPGLDKIFMETSSPTLHEPENKLNLLDVLHKWLEENPNAALIAIDTLAKIRNQQKGNKSVYQQDYGDIEGLQRLASHYKVAILLVTHDRKEEDSDPFKTITGSTAIVGAADAAWVLTKKRGETEGSLFISGRDIEERRGTLQFDKDSGLWRWIGDTAELKMNDLERDIRNAILEAGKPCGSKEICEQLGLKTSGRDYDRINKAVQRMKDRGELEKSAGRGKYTLPPEDFYYRKSSNYQDTGPEQMEVYLDHI
jgi:5S rRNA maturation endonuclease (ribonuclease M5)